MKLYFSGNSPYARRARIAARLGELSVEEVDVSPLQVEGHFLLKHGPGVKVPGLETDAGTYLCECLIITNYLNQQAEGKLMPSEGAGGEAALELEGIGSLLMDSLYVRTMENRRDLNEKSLGLIEKETARASRCYDALDIRLAGQSATLHLGTIAAVASLGYADWRHPDDDWRHGRDGLKAWFDEMMQNPAVAETKPIF